MQKLILLTVLLLPFLFTYSQVRIGSYDGESHAVVYNNGWGDGDSYIHIGNNAGVNANSTGTYFTNIGYAAGRYNSSMNFNVHLGYAAGNRGTEAIKNVAIGAYAMYADSGSNMTGDNSTSVGHESMYNISSGYNNSGLGYQSFYNLTTGYDNTAIGNFAGGTLLTGYKNTYLGNSTDASSTSAINQTMIGYDATGQADNSVTLGNSDVTAIYMAQDSGATVYAAGLNLGGTAITATAAEINLLDGVTTVGSGILSSATESGNTGVRLSTSSASNHGDIGSNAVDLSYQNSTSSTKGATGYAATALGYLTTASGNRSTATGNNTVASGHQSTSMGELTTASGRETLASGNSTTASGNYSTAMGLSTTASGAQSTAMGRLTTASGISSLALGYSTTASGHQSISAGNSSNASASYSTSIGYGSVASDFASTVIGQYNSSGSSVTNNATSFNIANTAFVIGNGTSGSLSDAFKVMFNGDTTVSNDLTVNGDVVVSSDARLKSNIVSLGSTLSRLLLIDGKSYTMIKDGKQKIGVLAQEIKEVFPELVSEDANEMLAVNYHGLVPVLINARKEQQSEIDELKDMVKQLISEK